MSDDESGEFECDEKSQDSQSEISNEDACENLDSTSELSSDDEGSDGNIDSIIDEESRVLNIISLILHKIRSITKLTRKSNIVQNHVLKLVRDDESIKHDISFIIDFFVRWNSTYKMIERFIKLKQVVISLTSLPERIDGINDCQVNKLKKWLFSSEEWALVEILSKILQPFFMATELASGQAYPTLAISFIIALNLKKHLSSNESTDEGAIKRLLLGRLNYHLDSKISKKQKEFTLVN